MAIDSYLITNVISIVSERPPTLRGREGLDMSKVEQRGRKDVIALKLTTEDQQSEHSLN